VDTYGHLIPGSNRQAVNRLDDATGRNLPCNRRDRRVPRLQLNRTLCRGGACCTPCRAMPRHLTALVLFTMLTALGVRYPPGREPPLIAALRQWLGGWPGIGRITAGMARQGYNLQLA